jgi:cell division protein FtsB
MSARDYIMTTDLPRIFADWLPLVNAVLAYLVIPLLIVIRNHSQVIHDLKVELAVLRAQHDSLRDANVRENAETRTMLQTVLVKLNSIEEHLRK